ncbi:MAG: ABC transporter permease [Deltaproteobacteria bacterium]|nr:ABC transporter permease [Deltaproteobacteria bacterium]
MSGARASLERTLAYLKKTFWENLRDWKVLILALVFGPFFVFMMYGYFVAAAPAYTLLVANEDAVAAAGGSRVPAAAAGLLASWRSAQHPDGKPIFNVVPVDDAEAARAKIESRDADLLVRIPEGFSQRLAAFRDRRSGEPAQLTYLADGKNARAAMAMALSDYTAFAYAANLTQAPLPLSVAVQSVGAAQPLDDFEIWVPALLVLALIMVLFTAATALVREVDQGTMARLMLSRLRTGELLAAVSVNQVLVGVVALALTYLSARACGFHGAGSLAVLLVVGAVTTLSVVALSVLTAAFLKSMFELLTVGVFPFFILMFFSECMFPLPKIEVAAIAGHQLYANDVLPTSLCVRAFNKILNCGGGLADVGFEIVAIAALTAVYFALGTWLFRRRHLRV